MALLAQEHRQTHQIRVPDVSAADVQAWHARPGAVDRLTPAVLGSVAAAPTEGLAVGSRTKLRVGPGIPWTAVHTPSSDRYGFVDEQESGPFGSWRHVHTFADVDGGATVRDEVSWRLPVPAPSLVTDQVAAMVEQMFGYRSRQLLDDFAFHTRMQAAGITPRTFAVSGASGLVGRQLCALLTSGGHRVRRLVRGSTTDPDEITWDPAAGRLDPEQLRGVDAVIHLAGEPIGQRFTQAHKERVLHSRTTTTGLLARTLAGLAGDGRDRVLVCASAMGWYGTAAGDSVLTEDLPAGKGFLAEVCRQWEAAADPAREAGIRTVHVRTGIVQSAAGGQLALQLPLFRAGLGGPLGNGRQWMSWISLDDLVELYAVAALTPAFSGPVNAAAPEPVRANEYAATLGRVLGRPHALRVPAFGPALLLGQEGADELALASQRLSVDRAVAAGQRFRHPTLEAALRHELCR